MVSNTATVLRGGPDPVDLPLQELVPGDRVLLSATDLFVGQAAMTGGSLPVEKFALVRQASPNAGAIGWKPFSSRCPSPSA